MTLFWIYLLNNLCQVLNLNSPPKYLTLSDQKVTASTIAICHVYTCFVVGDTHEI